MPSTPNRSDIGTATPRLASTACTEVFIEARQRESFARWRTSSRSARTGSGAIWASGNRPIRSRSARSAASRSSFLTRRVVNPLIPNGCARCTWAPSRCSVSTAQYQP